MKSRLPLKIVSGILVASFALQEISYAQGGSVKGPASSKEIRLPVSLGFIQENHSRSSKETILHIQDAHDSLEAQRKITEILNVLADDYEVRSFALEGSSGAIDPLLFRSYPDQKAARETAERLVREGALNAGEFFAVTSEKPVAVYGAEDQTLYRENLKAFKDLLRSKELIAKDLNGLAKTLEVLAERVYGEKVKELRRGLRDNENAGFVKKWHALKDLAEAKKVPLDMPNLKLLSSVADREKGIHFAKANDERRGLLSLFQERVKGEALQKIFAASLSYKAGKITDSGFHVFLREAASRHGISFAGYPNLERYTEYLELFDQVDLARVVQEIETAKETVEAAYIVSEDERALSGLEKDLWALSNVVSGAASSKEFGIYSSSPRSLGGDRLDSRLKHAGMTTDFLRLTQKYHVPLYEGLKLERIFAALPQARRFYALAQKRDEALIKNTLKKMRARGEHVAALVTGGFHTQGISGILKNEDLSHLVVLPKITDTAAKRPYLTILTRKRGEIEKAFASDASRYRIALGTLLDAGRANPFISPADIRAILSPFVEDLRKKGDVRDGIRRWMTAYRAAYRNDPVKDHHLRPEKIEAILENMTEAPAASLSGARLAAGRHMKVYGSFAELPGMPLFRFVRPGKEGEIIVVQAQDAHKVGRTSAEAGSMQVGVLRPKAAADLMPYVRMAGGKVHVAHLSAVEREFISVIGKFLSAGYPLIYHQVETGRPPLRYRVVYLPSHETMIYDSRTHRRVASIRHEDGKVQFLHFELDEEPMVELRESPLTELPESDRRAEKRKAAERRGREKRSPEAMVRYMVKVIKAQVANRFKDDSFSVILRITQKDYGLEKAFRWIIDHRYKDPKFVRAFHKEFAELRHDLVRREPTNPATVPDLIKLTAGLQRHLHRQTASERGPGPVDENRGARLADSPGFLRDRQNETKEALENRLLRARLQREQLSFKISPVIVLSGGEGASQLWPHLETLEELKSVIVNPAHSARYFSKPQIFLDPVVIVPSGLMASVSEELKRWIELRKIPGQPEMHLKSLLHEVPDAASPAERVMAAHRRTVKNNADITMILDGGLRYTPENLVSNLKQLLDEDRPSVVTSSNPSGFEFPAFDMTYRTKIGLLEGPYGDPGYKKVDPEKLFRNLFPYVVKGGKVWKGNPTLSMPDFRYHSAEQDHTITSMPEIYPLRLDAVKDPGVLPRGKKVVLIETHPDDVALNFFALTVSLLLLGNEVHVLSLMNEAPSPERLRALGFGNRRAKEIMQIDHIRRAENERALGMIHETARRFARQIGIPEGSVGKVVYKPLKFDLSQRGLYALWHFPDEPARKQGYMIGSTVVPEPHTEKEKKALFDYFCSVEPKLVVGPAWEDNHAAHREVNRLTRNAFEDYMYQLRPGMGSFHLFEISHSSTDGKRHFAPDFVLVSEGEVLEAQKRVMSVYGSQTGRETRKKYQPGARAVENFFSGADRDAKKEEWIHSYRYEAPRVPPSGEISGARLAAATAEKKPVMDRAVAKAAEIYGLDGLAVGEARHQKEKVWEVPGWITRRITYRHRLDFPDGKEPVIFYTKEYQSRVFGWPYLGKLAVRFHNRRIRKEAELASRAARTGLSPDFHVLHSPEGISMLLMAPARVKPLRELSAPELSASEEAGIVTQFGYALGMLHSLGLVHGDLVQYSKWDPFFLRMDHIFWDDGQKKVSFIDFGAAREASRRSQLAEKRDVLDVLGDFAKRLDPETLKRRFDFGYLRARSDYAEIGGPSAGARLAGRGIREINEDVLYYDIRSTEPLYASDLQPEDAKLFGEAHSLSEVERRLIGALRMKSPRIDSLAVTELGTDFAGKIPRAPRSRLGQTDEEVVSSVLAHLESKFPRHIWQLKLVRYRARFNEDDQEGWMGNLLVIIPKKRSAGAPRPEGPGHIPVRGPRDGEGGVGASGARLAGHGLFADDFLRIDRGPQTTTAETAVRDIVEVLNTAYRRQANDTGDLGRLVRNSEMVDESLWEPLNELYEIVTNPNRDREPRTFDGIHALIAEINGSLRPLIGRAMLYEGPAASVPFVLSEDSMEPHALSEETKRTVLAHLAGEDAMSGPEEETLLRHVLDRVRFIGRVDRAHDLLRVEILKALFLRERNEDGTLAGPPVKPRKTPNRYIFNIFHSLGRDINLETVESIDLQATEFMLDYLGEGDNRHVEKVSITMKDGSSASLRSFTASVDKHSGNPGTVYEARLLSRLSRDFRDPARSSPIQAFYGMAPVLPSADRFVIFKEFVPGRDLRQIARELEFLGYPPDRRDLAVRIARATGRTLGSFYARMKNIPNDLHPGNLVYDDQRQAATLIDLEKGFETFVHGKRHPDPDEKFYYVLSMLEHFTDKAISDPAFFKGLIIEFLEAFYAPLSAQEGERHAAADMRDLLARLDDPSARDAHYAVRASYDLNPHLKEAVTGFIGRTGARLSAIPEFQKQLLEGVGERTPDWLRLNDTAEVFLESDHRRLSLKKIQEAAAVKFRNKGVAVHDSEHHVAGLLERLAHLGLVRKEAGAYALKVSKRVLAVKTNNAFFIKKELEKALKARGAAHHAALKIVEDYAKITDLWHSYPVESRWPVLRAVSLLAKEDQELLIRTIQSANGDLKRLGLVDSILLMFNRQAADHWLEEQAPGLIGRTIYYVSPETWLVAGGLGRVGQYHTLSMKALVGDRATIATIEPLYPWKLTHKNEMEKVDYSKLPVPVEGLNEQPDVTYEVAVRGQKTAVEAFNGTNKHGIHAHLIKDRDNFQTKLLYRYGPEWGSATWPDFTEFFSRAALELIQTLERKKRTAAGEHYKSPVIVTNDGQTGLFPYAKRDHDKSADPEDILKNALVWMVTHTYRNRGIFGYESRFLDGRVPLHWWNYYTRIGLHDATSGGRRLADGTSAVAATHSYEVSPIDPGVMGLAITNGDDLDASSAAFREVISALYPDADPARPTAEQAAAVKAEAKRRASRDARLIELNPGIAKLDPDRIVIGYFGRLVEEKAGRARAFTDDNIRELVAKGAQVIHAANVQAGKESRRMHDDLKALENEVNAKGPGRLIVLTGWSQPEQITLLAATDVQVQDSDRGTEAAGFTESDIAANAGLQVAPPGLEGILQNQGIILDRSLPGSGNTLVPADESPAAYLDVFLWLVRMFSEDRPKFASYQAVSVPLSRVLTARIPAAEYLRQFEKALVRKEQPLKVVEDYLLRKRGAAGHLRSEWLRKDLAAALEHSGHLPRFQTDNPDLKAYLARLHGKLRIILIDTGMRNEGSAEAGGRLKGRKAFEAVLGEIVANHQEDISVVDSEARKAFDHYRRDELFTEGLWVVVREPGIQVLDLVPTKQIKSKRSRGARLSVALADTRLVESAREMLRSLGIGEGKKAVSIGPGRRREGLGYRLVPWEDILRSLDAEVKVFEPSPSANKEWKSIGFSVYPPNEGSWFQKSGLPEGSVDIAVMMSVFSDPGITEETKKAMIAELSRTLAPESHLLVGRYTEVWRGEEPLTREEVERTREAVSRLASELGKTDRRLVQVEEGVEPLQYNVSHTWTLYRVEQTHAAGARLAAAKPRLRVWSGPEEHTLRVRVGNETVTARDPNGLARGLNRLKAKGLIPAKFTFEAADSLYLRVAIKRESGGITMEDAKHVIWSGVETLLRVLNAERDFRVAKKTAGARLAEAEKAMVAGALFKGLLAAGDRMKDPSLDAAMRRRIAFDFLDSVPVKITWDVSQDLLEILNQDRDHYLENLRAFESVQSVFGDPASPEERTLWLDHVVEKAQSTRGRILGALNSVFLRAGIFSGSGARLAEEVKVLLADKPANDRSALEIARLAAAHDEPAKLLPAIGIGKDRDALREVIEKEKPAVVVIRSDTKAFKDPAFIKFSKENGVKVIIRAGVGVDNVDTQAATEAGIAVVRTHGNANSVANLTLRFLLASIKVRSELSLGRRILVDPQGAEVSRIEGWKEIFDVSAEEFLKAKDRSEQKGRGTANADQYWRILPPMGTDAAEAMFRQLEGKTIGLIGFGAVAQAFAAKLKAVREITGISFSVIATSPSLDRGDWTARALADNLWVGYPGEKEVLKNSDIVSLHLPGEAEHYFTAEKLKDSKISALINTSRHGVLHPGVWKHLIARSILYFADVDLMEEGKPVFEIENLRSAFPNTLYFTPHIAASTDDAAAGVEKNTLKALDAVLETMRGRVPDFRLDIVNGVPIELFGARLAVSRRISWPLMEIGATSAAVSLGHSLFGVPGIFAAASLVFSLFSLVHRSQGREARSWFFGVLSIVSSVAGFHVLRTYGIEDNPQPPSSPKRIRDPKEPYEPKPSVPTRYPQETFAQTLVGVKSEGARLSRETMPAEDEPVILVGVADEELRKKLREAFKDRKDIRVVRVGEHLSPEDKLKTLEKKGARLGAAFTIFYDDDDLNAGAKSELIRSVSEADLAVRPLFGRLLRGEIEFSDLPEGARSTVFRELITLLPAIAPKTVTAADVRAWEPAEAFKQFKLRTFHPSFGDPLENLVIQSPEEPRAAVWSLSQIVSDPFFFEALKDRDQKLRRTKMKLDDHVIVPEGTDPEEILGERTSEFLGRFLEQNIHESPGGSIHSVYAKIEGRYKKENVLFIDRAEKPMLADDEPSLKFLTTRGEYAVTPDKIVTRILARSGSLEGIFFKGLKQIGNRFFFELQPLDFARQFRGAFLALSETQESA